MILNIVAGLKASYRFRDYRPQRVTPGLARQWFQQYDKNKRKAMRRLLDDVVYLSEKQTISILKNLNTNLTKRLSNAGISTNNIIYIQIDAAGSSSPFMLHTLRDLERLERKGCLLLDSKDIMTIRNETERIHEGAIIYVDDFVGTGKQFLRSRQRVSEYIAGNFSEFLLAPCICEEAIEKLNDCGVEPISHIQHQKNERPLHPESDIYDPDDKRMLTEICQIIHRNEGLGFKKLATMVVLYRNSPNTVPLILRGSLSQNPYIGLLPRTTDLPPII